MGGRKDDSSFIACTENWVDTFMFTIVYEEPEERPSRPMMRTIKIPENVEIEETIEETIKGTIEERIGERIEGTIKERIEYETEDILFRLSRLRLDETNMTRYYETFVDFIGRIESDGKLVVIRYLTPQQEVEEQVE